MRLLSRLLRRLIPHRPSESQTAQIATHPAPHPPDNRRDTAPDACLYTRCIARTPFQQATLTARTTLAATDHAAWFATFDEEGHFLDPTSGFWESLSGEVYAPLTGTWHDAFAIDDTADDARSVPYTTKTKTNPSPTL